MKCPRDEFIWQFVATWKLSGHRFLRRGLATYVIVGMYRALAAYMPTYTCLSSPAEIGAVAIDEETAKKYGLAHREGRTRSLQICGHGATVHPP